MGTAHLYGSDRSIRNPACGAAGIHGTRTGKISLFIACLRKIILLIPLIYILPHFFADKVFAVFLAEPVSDFISVIVAATLFFLNIKKILKEGEV